MKKTILVIVFIAAIVALFAYTSQYNTQNVPKAPPTWAWTKIAHVTIVRYQGPITEATTVSLSINVRKNIEQKTVAGDFYSGSNKLATYRIYTTITKGNATIVKSYSDTQTKFLITSKIPVSTTFAKTIRISLISSRNTTYYLGTYGDDTESITYTYTYIGNNTWIGYYNTTTTMNSVTIKVKYRASIIQQ